MRFVVIEGLGGDELTLAPERCGFLDLEVEEGHGELPVVRLESVGDVTVVDVELRWAALSSP